MRGHRRNEGRSLGFLAGLALVLLLTACSSLWTSDIEPPEVSLAGMGFGEPGLFEQQLRVDLRLSNPNNFDLEIDRVTFNLELNDKPFAHGRAKEGLDLPALGETVVPVTINVATNDLIDRVMELGTERRLDYRLTGEADLASLFFGRVPFHKEGKLALPRLPGLEQPKP
jgi:LEA14-like dessication related protein